MAEKNNSICDICGKGYYVCRSCKDSANLYPFKNFTDTAEHYKVFQVIRGYTFGIYTKEDAREKFKNIDLHDLESFRPHIKQIVKDILKEEKHIVDNVDGATTVKSTASRKRNYKVNKVEVDTIIENENAEIE